MTSKNNVFALAGSVGKKTRRGKLHNIFFEVVLVQQELNKLIANHRQMKVDLISNFGVITDNQYDSTVLAIIYYQRYVLGLPETKVTGRIESGKYDINKLMQLARLYTQKAPDVDKLIKSKLVDAWYSQELENYLPKNDPQGYTKCMLNLLVNNPKVDDQFINSWTLGNYLRLAPTDTQPPPVETVLKASVLATIKFIISPQGVNSEPITKVGTKQVINELSKVRLDIVKSFREEANRAADVYSLAVARRTGIGPAAAALMFVAWAKKQSENENSIYSCFKDEMDEQKTFFGTIAPE